MTLGELEKRRSRVRTNAEVVLDNMDKLATESERVADVAHHAPAHLEALEQEFNEMTALSGEDAKFLFLATALQVLRIVLANQLTKIDAAGKGNRNENALHDLEDDIFDKFSAGSDTKDYLYHACMQHIISDGGVPYDAQNFLTRKRYEQLKATSTWNLDIEAFITEKLNLFGKNPGVAKGKGANHRFSTLGHDASLLGLIFGTANILTNTITCVGTPLFADKLNLPVFQTITSNHVIYSHTKTTQKGIAQYKDPSISVYTPTSLVLYKTAERAKKQPQALIAALIKQIIHIGTDLYTPCGIQIPAANLIWSKDKVEELTKYVSVGDILKIQVSDKLSELINMVIGALHILTYNEYEYPSLDVFSVKTEKIILYSNYIATSSNVILTAARLLSGDEIALKDLDVAGLLVLMKHIAKDQDFIQSIREEYVLGGFRKMIQGNGLNLQEIT